MMKWKLALLTVLLTVAMVAIAQSGPAVTADAGQPAADLSAADNQAKPAPAKPAAPSAAKKPEQKPLGISFGVNERFRVNAYNNTDNNWKANDEVRDYRFRTQVWMNVPFGRNVDAFVQMSNETVKKLINLSAPYNGKASPMVAGEIWFDQAYVKFKKLPIEGLNLQVGRWNLGYGDGWFLGDGTASNGGRDYFFTAFDMGYQFKNTKQSFNVIGIMNPRWDDQFPVFNGRNPKVVGQGGCLTSGATLPSCALPYANTFPSSLNDVDTLGLVGYYKNRTSKKRDIDIYYAYSKEYNFGQWPTWNPAVYTNAYVAAHPTAKTNSSAYLYQPDRHLSTIGERMVFKFSRDIVLNEEFAYQFGKQDTMKDNLGAGLYPQIDVRAWGSYGHLTKYNPKTWSKPYLRFKWWLASGADPKDSKTDANFDPNLGARYNMNPGSNFDPQYGYSAPMWWNFLTQNQVNEITNSAFYPANMIAIGPEVGFSPFKSLQLIGDFKWVGAFNKWAVNPAHFGLASSLLPARFVGATGTTRLKQVGANLKWTSKFGLSETMMYEYVWFGDFYGAAYRAPAFFFRNEINYRWSGFIPFTKKSQAK